jgi:homoserine kinase
MKVVAEAPATLANLGAGYDVIGLCLEGPWDRVSAEPMDRPGVELCAVSGDGGRLARDAAQNCAGIAALRVLERWPGRVPGVRLTLEKGLPLGSGLGSSAASSVAGALATAALVAPNLPREELLDACREGERLAAGSPHADNVAPSLLGGVVACLPGPAEAVEIVRLSWPPDLFVGLAHPAIEVRTADARAVLPGLVPRADAIANVARVAGLVTALARGDYELLGRCLEDRLATPYRKGLVPGYDRVIAAAIEAGAVGGGLSGSGPTIFALAQGRAAAERAAAAMVAGFREEHLEARGWASAVNSLGARLA